MRYLQLKQDFSIDNSDVICTCIVKYLRVFYLCEIITGRSYFWMDQHKFEIKKIYHFYVFYVGEIGWPICRVLPLTYIQYDLLNPDAYPL